MPGLSGEGVLLEALDGLSADDKEIIRLAAWEELPRRDMAVILDMTPKTVRPWLSGWIPTTG
ncbi:MAG TPA: sigma factor-like helix-turn-helix DNA-binding protein [Acidimicrobiia bacterium]